MIRTSTLLMKVEAQSVMMCHESVLARMTPGPSPVNKMLVGCVSTNWRVWGSLGSMKKTRCSVHAFKVTSATLLGEHRLPKNLMSWCNSEESHVNVSNVSSEPELAEEASLSNMYV